jgi:hypothetical protein
MNTREGDEMQTMVVENRIWRRSKCDIDTYCAAFPKLWSCKIVDLSERGMGIVSTTNMYKGAVVNFTDLKAIARVVWTKDNRAGLKIIN